MPITNRHTAEELIARPGSARYELIKGVMFEASLSGMRASVTAMMIGARLALQVQVNHLGFVPGSEGGFILSRDPDSVVAPDVGFVRADRLSEGVPAGYVPFPSDFAIEVISPTDTSADIERKQRLYESAGVRLVWWVDPAREVVTVYRPGANAQVVGVDGSLDGGDVVPGFALNLADLCRTVR